MSPALFSEIASTAAQSATQPDLSVLVPFYRDDAAGLIAAFAGQGDGAIELVLLDDGCPDATLNAKTASAVRDCPWPARLVSARTNLGRAAARNALAHRARARWLLYLDADMELADGFLARWRAIAAQADFDAAFGGFEIPENPAPEHGLHAALARAGDVETAEQRTLRGPAAVCSSNLLVRAALMEEIAFDEGFTGWGWEDVDWAVRAAQAGRLVHVDNPAAHAGLQPAGVLLSKFGAGGVNFARFLARHPEMAALPGARAARAMKRLGLAPAIRAMTRPAVRLDALPVRARVIALKLYRAACAAEAL